MRRLLFAFALLLVLTASAQADGDPASDVLVFKSYFLPYAPQTPVDAEQKLNVATAAADRAGYPIRVAVISSAGDLGIVPQYVGKPQEYATFLGQELKFAYKGGLLIVMEDGYGLYGIDDPKVHGDARRRCPKPASNDPNDLAIAGAERRRGALRRGRQDARSDGAPPTRRNTATRRPARRLHNGVSTSVPDGGGSRSRPPSCSIVGGSVGLLVALVGLFWWVRRAPRGRRRARRRLVPQVAGQRRARRVRQHPHGREVAVDHLDAAAGAVERHQPLALRDREGAAAGARDRGAHGRSSSARARGRTSTRRRCAGRGS